MTLATLRHAAVVISTDETDSDSGVCPAQHGVERMVAVAWAPNNHKIAAYRKEKGRLIYLYDEFGENRDKFQTRPAERLGKDESSSYTVMALAFSPDSTKLAVGQTDGMIFIYKVGEDFKMKKAIVNKHPQESPVTFILWPNEQEIICALFNGKLLTIPAIGLKGASHHIFYDAPSSNIALASNTRYSEIASAHVDGSIAVFSLDSSDLPSLRHIIQHPCPAYGLAYGSTHLIAAGSDCKISVYEDANLVQQFDYSRESGDRDFVTACGSPSGLAVVVGGYDRIRVFRWAPRKKLWEEGPFLDMENFYSITSLAWNREGTRIMAGTMIGGLHIFESVLRKMKTDTYEVAFATPYHAIVTIRDPPMTAGLESQSQLEILDVKIMGNQCYAVALTLETMMICDIEKGLLSEVRWDNNEDEEQFYFDNPSVCMVFHNAEMTLIEYGNNKVLGTFRTEFLNPHMISVRINERIPASNVESAANKKLAYLIDHQTITVVDLVYNANLGYVTHDSNIDWLELNETCVKLVFRDRRLRLILVDIDTMVKHNILQICNFVQWVPSSDVLVAQSKKNLCVWYNVNTPDQFVEIETNGLAFDVVREDKKTSVLIQDENVVNEIELELNRIEFGTAMMDGDYIRAMLYLEIADPAGKTETGTMWKQLSKDAIEAKELKIAERACYACGDFSKAKYLADTVEIAEDAYLHGVEDQPILSTLQARTSTLAGDLQVTQNVFLENDNIDAAVQMYKSIHKWKEAFTVLGNKPSPARRLLAKQYIKYLEKTGQDEVMAEFMEEHGNYEIAAVMYLRCGLPIKAARVIQSHFGELNLDSQFISDLGTALIQNGFYIEAAEFYDIAGQDKKAYENYRKSKQFVHALRVAKKSFPNFVVSVEEEWADNLFENRLFDLACTHYIEAGRLRKALKAAIDGRQWNKALHIIEVVDDVKSVTPEYIRIGDFYQLSENLQDACNCYVKAGEHKRAINMYKRRGLWDEAYNVALISPEGHEPLAVEFTRRAEKFIQESNYREAERVFCALGSADSAIAMYNSVEMYDDMFRLVEKYHPSHLTSSYQHLATVLSTKNPKAAEMYYLKVGAHDLALSMYVENKMWEDALRMAKAYQGGDGFKKVVFTWAQSLGVDLGFKLLKRFNLVEECMEYMCTQHEFALDIAPMMSKDKVKEVNILQAKYLEYDQAKYDEAVSSYVKGGNPEAAVEMCMKHNMFEQAIEVAEGYCRNKLDDILIRYARALFQQKHYTKFEAVLFNAQRPGIAVEMYRDENMWIEAFKVCNDHVPNMLETLQQQFDLSGKDKIRLRSDAELVDQGIEFERMGENKGAVDCYLKLGDEGIGDVDLLAKYWKRGADLATSFFRDSYGEKAIAIFSEKLGSIGCHMDAADLWSAIGRHVEAVEQLIAGRHWVEAERAAGEIDPGVQQYVRDRYTDALKESKSVEELSTVNLSAALEFLEQEGQWEDLLDRAKVDEHQMLYYLEKYVILLIEDKNPMKALEMYQKYGLSSWKPNINTFENLIYCYFQEDIDTYESNALLREIAYKFAILVKRDPEADEEDVIVMDGYRHMCNLFANRSAFREIPELKELAVRLDVALLRYTDILPVERCFFDAGVGCKAIGWANMAFVFLNHYMDVFEAIEAGLADTSAMDYSELEATDIPQACCLPSFHSIEGPDHEQVREWVLSASMDRNISPELRLDFRGEYEANLTNRGSDEVFEPCIISGYPAINNPISFMDGAKPANKTEWDTFYKVFKTGAYPNLQDIYSFLVRWSRGTLESA